VTDSLLVLRRYVCTLPYWMASTPPFHSYALYGNPYALYGRYGAYYCLLTALVKEIKLRIIY